MRTKYLSLIFVVLLIAAGLPGCSGGGSTGQSTYSSAVTQETGSTFIVAGASYNPDDGAYVAAEVSRWNLPVTDAEVQVNGIPLDYGLPLEYNGVTQDSLPIYYRQMSFKPGDSLTLQASLPGNGPFYSETVTVPGAVTITQPAAGQVIPDQDPLDVLWNNLLAPQLYLLSLDGLSDSYDTVTTGTTARIPAESTLPGEAGLTVAAFNGNNLEDIFYGNDADLENGEDDPPLDKSYWLASTYDENEVEIQATPAGEAEHLSTGESARPLVPLQVLKVERVKVKDVWVTQKTYDANQITAPGNALLSFKMKKRHLAVAAVYVYDMSGNQYFKWDHVRAYKRKSKWYNFNIALSPGSTVVFAKKQTDEGGMNYQY